MRAVLDNFEGCLRQRRQREARAWGQLICYVLTVLRELPEDDVCWMTSDEPTNFLLFSY